MEFPYGAYVVLWIALILAVPFAVVAALIQVWNMREKRDGKR
jgi:ABC-type phosphate transport system permease subunit